LSSKDAPAPFADKWLRAKELSWAADLLAEFDQTPITAPKNKEITR